MRLSYMHGFMAKEFKLAKLEKKEKMLKAQLEFIGQMKEMIKKCRKIKDKTCHKF